MKTLTELREWNIAHRTRGAIKYGQSQLDISDEMDLDDKDRARTRPIARRTSRLARTHGIDEVMKAHKLDALLFPGASGAAIAAKPGYPTVIVPFGVRAERATPGTLPVPTASTRSPARTASASPGRRAASRG